MASIDFINGTEPPEQDFIYLDGAKSPGKCTITGAGVIRTWDKQKGFGFSGATLIYTGDDLSDFQVIIDLWHKSQWKDWATFARVLVKPPVGPPRKQKIEHPILTTAPLKIQDVVLGKCSQWSKNIDLGIWTCTIAFSEYRARLPALGKPTPAIPSAAGKILSPPSAFELQMQQLLAQQKTLGGGL